METYFYTAMNQDGKRVQGEKRAENLSHLYSLLMNENLYCLSTRQKLHFEMASLKPNNKEISMMCKQLAAMLKSGIPLVNSLDMLYQKTESTKMKRIYAQLVEEVRKGSSLTISLRQGDAKFPALMIFLIQAGELNGTLDLIMERLSVHYEKEHRLANKITSAMIYPIFLLGTTVLIVIALMTMVLPTFFDMIGTENLPWNTMLLIHLSNAITNYWYLILIGIVALVMGIKAFLKIPAVELKKDELKLKMPVVGKLNRIIATARFSRTFSSLYASGISVIETLKISGDVLNNKYLSMKIENISEMVRKGEPLSKSIESSEAFDPLLNSMLYVGEESGSLEDVMITVADYFDAESENATQKLIALMEPAMILILAIIIFFVIVSILMPIYDSYSSLA